MRTIIFTILTFAVLIFAWNATAYRDIEFLKKNAPAFVEKSGFEITAYEGYLGGIIEGGGVWYQARDKNDRLYTFEVREFRGEFQLYNITCLDAVSNR